MTCPRRAFLLVAVLLLVAPLPAVSQVAETAPITIKAPKPKKKKFRAEVLSVTRVAITARSRENYNLVRTFTFDEKLATQIGEQWDKNKPYQFADRVEIEYIAGGDVATK